MFRKIFLVLVMMLSCGLAWSQEFPAKPSSPVADFTNTLSDNEKALLEQKIRTFEDSTSTQIAVAIIKSVGEYDINEYGALLGRNWGVGEKDKNNGVLVLVAMNDHKVTIQTGYGLEGALPDATTQQIIQDDIKPKFRAGEYYAGLNNAVDDIIKATRGEYKADPKKHQSRKGSGTGGAGFIIIIIVFILILVFRNRGGGGGHIIGSRGGASPFWWFLAGNMLGGGGRSSGSDWGGFSGGGGGSSGGGWGGFGGGSFGGGGSSGSW